MYSIEDIKKISADKGHKWFDPSSMKFFRTKVLPTVYEGPGGVFFISSEQFVPSSGRAAARKYTVRQFNPTTGKVSTFGGQEWFNKLTIYQARTRAKEAAAGRIKEST